MTDTRCAHGRADSGMCPWCLGINTPSSADEPEPSRETQFFRACLRKDRIAAQDLQRFDVIRVVLAHASAGDPDALAVVKKHARSWRNRRMVKRAASAIGVSL